MTVASLLAQYKSGQLTPRTLIADIQQKIKASDNPTVWIHLLSDEELAPYLHKLDSEDPQKLPLYGIPFAIKDNIDLAGVPTTAACPEFSYIPKQSAFVVEKLLQAGAIPIGKTNLDQFATGLVGTRSPYGVPRNPLAPERVPGGSSSGSAVAVASGLVSFALGTDTAGSGRVPACFNGIWGLKPSRGRLSNAGVVPACRTLDCVSIFALNAQDCQSVLACAEGYDPNDSYSNKPANVSLDDQAVIGIPLKEDLFFFGDAGYDVAWEAKVKELSSRFTVKEINFKPFLKAARLLYEGPWVAERYLAVKNMIQKNPDALHSVTRGIISKGCERSACDTFEALYQLSEYKREADEVLGSVTALVTPTAGDFPTLSAVEQDPIGINSQLGYYTNFMNLLDLCAVASPASPTKSGLPFGITWIAGKATDYDLLRLASGKDINHTDDYLPLLLFGAHMKGLPLNPSVLALGATFIGECKTAPHYRMVLLEATPPPRPGVIPSADGYSFACEKWLFPKASIGEFLSQIHQPLGLGEVELDDGRFCHGFLCAGAEGKDISSFVGWRAYCEQSKSP